MTQGTRQRILKTAEKLFLRQGVDGVSLRTISAEADVNLASINYHFGSKDNLVREVLARMVLPIDEERDRLLAEARSRSGGKPLPVRDLVRAFLLPWFTFREKNPRALAILMRSYSRGPEPANNPFRDVVTEMAGQAYAFFSEGVMQALPGADRTTTLKRINLAVTTASAYVFNGWFVESLKRVSGAAVEPDMLMDYLVGVIEGKLPGV